jgi:phosphopantetheine adenylyltransferase/dephospho-CoA kinase
LCSYLETLGLPTINCDQLGHEAYKKGTQCFSQIIETFGSDVLSEDKEQINRKLLGPKVFNNPEELKKLTSIMWPEIMRLSQERITKLVSEGYEVVVLDAAVLLEAGWDEMCHDVWVVIIPKEEVP